MAARCLRLSLAVCAGLRGAVATTFAFKDTPLQSLDLEDATGLQGFRGGFHDDTYGYVACGSKSVARFKLETFSDVQVLDVGVNVAWHHSCIFHDGTHGYAIQQNPFKVARFDLANFGNPAVVDLSVTDEKECKAGFAFQQYIYVHCFYKALRFNKNSFDSLQASGIETFLWPDDFGPDPIYRRTHTMIRCGSRGYSWGGYWRDPKLIRFDLPDFANAQVVSIHPSHQQAGFCTEKYGYAIPNIDPPARWGEFRRWSLDDISEQKSMNVGSGLPTPAAYFAAFHDGKYGYALPGYRHNGNYWAATGPHYTLVRFELNDFTFDTVEMLDISKLNTDWTLFGAGFRAGPFGYMVPTGHGNLVRFQLDLPATTTRTATTSTATTTSATSTATTTTTTVTTTTTAGANCTATHMSCPAPSVASGTYKMLGSEDASECSLQSSGGETFFHFAFGACNSTRVIRTDLNVVEETVTLIYRPPSFGSLLVGSERNSGAGAPAVVVCTCTTPMTALAGSGGMQTAPDKKAEGQNNIVGDTDFKVSFEMYPTDSFNTALPMGSLLPDSAQRLYFKVISLSPTDIIGLVNCTASPTDSINDPYAARFVTTSCPVGPLDYHRHHSETDLHGINSSLLNFKFAGSTEVFIWCSVIRCLTKPCGKCGSSQSRRLGVATPVARRLQGQGTLAQAWFQTEFSTAAVILPGPLLSRSSALVMWKPLAAPLVGDSDVRSNLTLFGFAANSSTSLEHLADAVAAALSKFVLRKVKVLRIMAAVLSSTRLLSDGLEASGRLRTEALIVENAVPAVHEEDHVLVSSKLTSLSHGGEVTATFGVFLRMEMEYRGLNVPARLQLFVRLPPAAAPPATPMLRQAPEGIGASTSLSTSLYVILICVACLITSCVCALFACFWWHGKCRRGSCPKTQPPPPTKVADTTQEVSGKNELNLVNATQEISGKKEANQGNGKSGFVEATQDVSGKSDDLNQDNGISRFLNVNI